MPRPDVFQPSDLSTDTAPDLASYGHRLLAEGDSWFSIGTLNPVANSSLLFQLEFARSACAINCATPGDTLTRMSQLNTDPRFIDLLCGRRARFWDGILLSCGGNDLIEALQAPAVDAAGQPVPPASRLLRTADEWDPPADGPSRYLSEAGWTTFGNYLRANFEHLLGLRDQGPSSGQPVFIHGYAHPTPRPAGAGAGFGPWLLPALTHYGVPDADGVALARELLSRLAVLLASIAADGVRFPHLHFFDTGAIALLPAAAGAQGASGDWVNEIHLTRAGYRKLGVPWGAAIERVLAP